MCQLLQIMVVFQGQSGWYRTTVHYLTALSRTKEWWRVGVIHVVHQGRPSFLVSRVSYDQKRCVQQHGSFESGIGGQFLSSWSTWIVRGDIEAPPKKKKKKKFKIDLIRMKILSAGHWVILSQLPFRYLSYGLLYLVHFIVSLLAAPTGTSCESCGAQGHDKLDVLWFGCACLWVITSFL